MDKTQIIAWLVARLQERSTWLGLVTLLSALGVSLAPDQVVLISTLGVAIAGGILAFTKDHNVAAAIEAALAAAAAAQALVNAAPKLADAAAQKAVATKK